MYCGRVIKCNMYRHVTKFHLDLAQLWRCPVSWCTVCKGNPQDCMDHVKGAHNVPWIVKTANMEQFVLPPSRLFIDSCGRIHLRRDTRGSQPAFFYLVTSTGASLQGLQAWASAYCLPEGLHVEVTSSAASAGGSAFGYCVTAS